MKPAAKGIIFFSHKLGWLNAADCCYRNNAPRDDCSSAYPYGSYLSERCKSFSAYV
ncbi:hypothetical protein [Methanosarcina horonobensis]|uniref:hypothetical protein n=1 Tax=Methanosarcina horonobensis TaxID=418008 RepID=UPI0022B92D9C|nr:hypothetical protein [Methanosarcina horonobensis]